MGRNVMPVCKKHGRVRTYVKFRNINNASQKENFHLPHKDVLVDDATRYALLYFMKGYQGYNQVQMANEDIKKPIFITQ